MAYAGGFNVGDAVRILNVHGVDLPGLPKKIVGLHGVVSEPNPRILAAMAPTEVPVKIAIPINDRKKTEDEMATYLLFPEYLELVRDATETTR